MGSSLHHHLKNKKYGEYAVIAIFAFITLAGDALKQVVVDHARERHERRKHRRGDKSPAVLAEGACHRAAESVHDERVHAAERRFAAVRPEAVADIWVVLTRFPAPEHGYQHQPEKPPEHELHYGCYTDLSP